MRLLVTGKVSDGAIALVSTGGSGGDPIGFHYHREAHDVFLCLKGHVNIWANDQARTMGPGDFASVPPVRTMDVPFQNTSCSGLTRQ
jgi:quercetin dioxygenase-like cupin family protein